MALFEAPSVHHESFAPAAIEGAVHAAFTKAGQERGASLSHRFEPQGFSVLVTGPAARVLLHTWPERALASLDLHASEELRALELMKALSQTLGWTCTDLDLSLRDKNGDRLLSPRKIGIPRKSLP